MKYIDIEAFPEIGKELYLEKQISKAFQKKKQVA